jgi:hypothetical protein
MKYVYKMKRIINITTKVSAISILLMVLTTCLLFHACEKKEPAAMPQVSYVRVTDAAKSDSLVTHAFMGNTVGIIGQNLRDVDEIWFNDQKAFVNFSFVTNTSIIVTIPNVIPAKVTNLMLLINSNKTDTLKYPFGVDVPAPLVSSLLCEYVDDGKTAVVQGNFFIDDPSSHLKVIFPGNIEGTVTSVSLTKVEVTVPQGAGVGPISVKSIYGTTRSIFYFRDDRNIILDYDILTTSGSWRGGTIKSDASSLKGNYLMLKGQLDDNQGAEDYTGGGFVSELWSDANGRPEKNFFTGTVADYLFKFEANVKVWTGAYLNICFGPWKSSVGPYQNQLYWSNMNARGLWKAWEGTSTGSFTTDGWITVTIPMSDMKYNKDFGTMTFDPNLAGSLTFWMKGPSATKGAKSDIEIYIDNVRIVHK